MSDSTPIPFRRSGERSSGPQGTRFFSTEALRQYASDAADGVDGTVSAHAPVLEGSSPGIEGRRFVIRPGRQAIGRRLDFLAQELNRESNTLTAKANDVDLANIGLELKSVVEQFREQVQNLE